MELCKESARLGKLGQRKVDIMQTMDEGYIRIEEHFLTNGSVLEDLTGVQKSLRSLPIVQLGLPTVVLVSALCLPALLGAVCLPEAALKHYL